MYLLSFVYIIEFMLLLFCWGLFTPVLISEIDLQFSFYLLSLLTFSNKVLLASYLEFGYVSSFLFFGKFV